MYSIGIAKKGTLYAEDKRQIDYGMPGTVGNISTVEIGRFPFASDYSHSNVYTATEQIDQKRYKYYKHRSTDRRGLFRSTETADLCLKSTDSDCGLPRSASLSSRSTPCAFKACPENSLPDPGLPPSLCSDPRLSPEDHPLLCPWLGVDPTGLTPCIGPHKTTALISSVS